MVYKHYKHQYTKLLNCRIKYITMLPCTYQNALQDVSVNLLPFFTWCLPGMG